MNTIVILAALVAAAVAAPGAQFPVSVSQDTLGNYKFNYRTEDASRTEHADSKNELTGQYTFVDKEGHHHQIQYSSGRAGFHASGESIPRSPALTPEVARATYEHNSRFNEVLRTLPVLREDSFAPHDNHHHIELPLVEYHHTEPVVIIDGVPQDTHEVQYAKKQLFLAHKEAIERLIH